MELKNRYLVMAAVAGLVLVSAVMVLNSDAGFDDKQAGHQVKKVEKVVGAGNLGTHTFYHLYLENGSRITFDFYEPHHPRCPERPEKCGEESKDPGWDEINQTVNSEAFEKSESTGETVFTPIEDVCLESDNSLGEC
jgi:hypothetical protein